MEDELWSVSERDAQSVPGARAPTCLIFESEAAVRRAWSYPLNWRDMDDGALWRLSELSAANSGVMEGLRKAFIASIVAHRRASVLLAAAKGVLDENRELRDRCEAIVRQCRAARRESHDQVATYARQERAAGSSAAEVLQKLTPPLSQTAFVMNDPQCAERLVSDVTRWCSEEFRAA